MGRETQRWTKAVRWRRGNCSRCDWCGFFLSISSFSLETLLLTNLICWESKSNLAQLRWYNVATFGFTFVVMLVKEYQMIDSGDLLNFKLVEYISGDVRRRTFSICGNLRIHLVGKVVANQKKIWFINKNPNHYIWFGNFHHSCHQWDFTFLTCTRGESDAPRGTDGGSHTGNTAMSVLLTAKWPHKPAYC